MMIYNIIKYTDMYNDYIINFNKKKKYLRIQENH